MSIKFEKSNIDEIMSKLISMRRISKDFHKKYVEPFMFTEELSGVRVTYLNKLDEVCAEFDINERTKQILINILQICFIIYEEIKESLNEASYFNHFFYSACFLAVKLESPGLFKRLKVRACDEQMNLSTIIELEKLILNRSSWRINMTTSIEMKNILISVEDSSKTAEFNENLENLIAFSLYDNETYRGYDNFTLTVACIFIACNYMQKDSKIYEDIVKSLQCDRVLVEECVSLILKRFYDDNSEQISQENSSSTSIMETNDTICMAGGLEASSMSRTSSCSKLYSLDQININDMMLCDEEETENIKFTNFSRVSGKGRKKLNSKLKKKKINKKMKNTFKAKKTRFFIERRLRLSKIVKK